MSAANTGGQAFPCSGDTNDPGMTLRDYFAAKAMQGLIADPERIDQSRKECARLAYFMADEMLAARGAA